jgi:hypothetical protein
VGGNGSLTAYLVRAGRKGVPTVQLLIDSRVTAVAVNPAMPRYALFGTASGQVAYVRLGATPGGNPR